MNEDLRKILSSKNIPEYYSSDESDPMCVVKLIGTQLPWEWYIIDGDVENGEFFGYVIGTYPEAGSFYLYDLIKAGCYVDNNYTPELLSVVMERAYE